MVDGRLRAEGDSFCHFLPRAGSRYGSGSNVSTIWPDLRLRRRVSHLDKGHLSSPESWGKTVDNPLWESSGGKEWKGDVAVEGGCGERVWRWSGLHEEICVIRDLPPERTVGPTGPIADRGGGQAGGSPDPPRDRDSPVRGGSSPSLRAGSGHDGFRNGNAGGYSNGTDGDADLRTRS